MSRPGQRRAISAALFLALGLVAAFAASAIAGFWDDEPADTGLRVLARAPEDHSSIRVEVLNGAGTAGLARNATHRLRSDGFDVVFFGNAARFDHARSTVIDRTGEPEWARAVALTLEIDSISTVIDSSLMLEVTVVLGADWPPPPRMDEGWSHRIRDLINRDTTGDSTGATTGDTTRAGSGG